MDLAVDRLGTYMFLASVSLFLSVTLSPVASDAAQQSPLSPTATPEEVLSVRRHRCRRRLRSVRYARRTRP